MAAGYKINKRERMALEHCAFTVETPGSFPPGVGDATLEELRSKGFIEWTFDELGSGEGYLITPEGREALRNSRRY